MTFFSLKYLSQKLSFRVRSSSFRIGHHLRQLHFRLFTFAPVRFLCRYRRRALRGQLKQIRVHHLTGITLYYAETRRIHSLIHEGLVQNTSTESVHSTPHHSSANTPRRATPGIYKPAVTSPAGRRVMGGEMLKTMMWFVIIRVCQDVEEVGMETTEMVNEISINPITVGSLCLEWMNISGRPSEEYLNMSLDNVTLRRLVFF